MVEKDKLLLEEYRLCQEKDQKLESTIWITWGAMGIGSIGSFAFLLRNGNDFRLVLATSFIVVLTVWIWWFIAKRWWDIQHTVFQRMRHIEEDLKYIFQIRYVDLKDGGRKPDSIDLEYLGYGDKKIGCKRMKEVKYNSSFARRGVQGGLKWFPLLITGAWLFIDFLVLSNKFQKIFDSLSQRLLPFECLVAIAVLAIFWALGLCTAPYHRLGFLKCFKKIRKYIWLVYLPMVALLILYVVLGGWGFELFLLLISGVIFVGGIVLLIVAFFKEKKDSVTRAQSLEKLLSSRC